jgi:hypothetical protein
MAREEGKIGIEKFDGTDFAYWKMQIEDIIYGKDLHQPLLGEQLDDMYDSEWALLDRKALAVIRLSLSKSVAHNVVKEKTTTGLMAALSSMYEKPLANNKVHLMKKLFNLKMAEGASVAQLLNEFNTITNQLSSVEIDFDDEIRTLIVLVSLPNSWEAVRMAVSNSAGKSKLSYEDVRDLVLSEEVRMKDYGETFGSGAALNLEARGKGQERNSVRGKSKSRKGRSKSKFGRQPECWNCGKTGHFKKNCRELKKKTDNDVANVVATEEVHDALLLSVDSPLDSWVLDSGASFHTTPIREILENYVAGNFGKVYLADGTALDVVGTGDVCIRVHSDSVWKLQKVRHIPKLKKNLISVGKLDDEGHSIHFHGGKWKVSKGARILAHGYKTGTLYMTMNSRDTITVADNGADSKLWHIRLGHMSEKEMKVLLSKGKLPELKSVESDLCEGCILGKQKNVSFAKVDRAPKPKKLELVHTDLWGPAPVASLGGSRYYITFIDDSSRKVWVYFLKLKYDVFEVFKKWKVMVETETGLKLKCLRSDNGGEYEDGGFKQFCAANGIRMEKTIPGTPQQNGVAERMNRTLNERARSMRLHVGLPKTFWADAVSTTAYLINRGPSVPLGHRLPEEVWSGNEVNLSHLKVFGCVSYVYIESNARSKLDAKSRKCYFIGYGDEAFGYRFWDDQNRKIIRSRNVTFNEMVVYKNNSSAKPVSTKLEAEKPEFINLDGISKGAAQRRNSEVDKDSEIEEGPKVEEIVDQHIEQGTPTVAVRRSTRTIRSPQRFSPSLFHILLTDGNEPKTFVEALEVEDSIKWELAMKDEMDSLLANQTWELIELPAGKKALHNKWVFRIKGEHDGSKRYKAR